MTICPVNEDVLKRAVETGLEDLEDAIQIAAAEPAYLDCIVTRNIQK